ncbi:MAG: hypothetical protein GY788_29265 [bacterium]|nr:hypothetical protein [bacterium]
MSLEKTSGAFNEHFPAWLRIEPRSRSDELLLGVQARVADPLWMLARQWQTGEFLGEDAGSPIRSELHYTVQGIDDVSLGGRMPEPPPESLPLEALVERESSAADYRDGVRIGQEFERRLLAKLIALDQQRLFASLIDHHRATASYPMAHYGPLEDEDDATRRFVRLMAGKVIDGMEALTSPLEVAPGFQLDQAVMDALHTDLVGWYELVYGRADSIEPPAWQPERLDYRFDLNSGPEPDDPDLVAEDQKTHLVAPDYRSGTLEWYSFSVGSSGSQGPWTTPFGAGVNPSVTTPTAIDVNGTSPRWWAFEDGYTNFGSLDVAKTDLAKLMLMEFVLIYGDDWYSVPASVPVGHAAKIDSLTVSNVFGEEHIIPGARQIEGGPLQRFDLFTLSPHSTPSDPGLGVDSMIDPDADSADSPVLFVPPLTGMSRESAPLEEVLFLRDEGANMLWAVETVIPNGLGRPVSAFDAQLGRKQRERCLRETERGRLVRALEVGEPDELERLELEKRIADLDGEIRDLTPHGRPPPSQSDPMRYRLATTVAENWIPFIPSQRASVPDLLHGPIQFRRSTMLRTEDVLTSTPVESRSRLLELNERALIWINEETVTRAGVRVQLTKQRTRSSDGETHVWVGRKVLTGRGEGASGLKFDVLEGPS